MNYKKIYDSLIFKAQNRTLEKGIYFEKHHIIPKCMDKTKIRDKNNIVKLTAREHFIAHLLLYKIYPNNNKLFFSLYMMGNFKIYGNRRYEWLRLKFSKYLSQMERNVSEETRQKIRNKLKGKTWEEIIGDKDKVEERRKKQSKALKGKKLSEKAKKNMSNSKKGKKLSEKHRQSLKGRIESNEVRENKSKRMKEYYIKHPEAIDKLKDNKNMLGKKHSLETKIKMSNSAKGKPKSKEAVEKRRKTITGLYKGEKIPNYKYIDFNYVINNIGIKTFKDIAKDLNISYPTLINHFRHNFGCSVTEHKLKNSINLKIKK